MKIRLSISLFIISVLVIFPRHFYIPPDGQTVDDGRNYALAYFAAHSQSYAWGKDVIYTYGPLGVLSTRWFPASYIFAQVTLDLYVLFCLSLAFVWIKRTGTRTELYLLSLSVVVSMWEINMLLQLLNIIYLIMIFRDRKAAILAIPIVVGSSLLVYVKLNTLIVTIPILITLFALLIKYRKIWIMGELVALLIALNIFFIYTLNVSPADYLKTALETVADWSYAMYMFHPYAEAPLHMAIFFSVVLCASLLYVLKWAKILLAGTVGVFYFVLFKEGFVRADMGHYMQYFRFLPLVFLCVYLLANSWKKIFAAILVLSALFVLADGYNEGVPLFSGDTPVVTYLAQLINDEAFVSDTTISRGGSVDYLNNSCLRAMTSQNRNWHHRPAFQSMIAISPVIDSINAAYYLSANAPDTVLYDNTSLDDLNPMWDDPQLKQVILRRYKIVGEYGHQFTLVKLPQPVALNYGILLDTVIGFGESISIPTGTADMKVEVSYTWMGRLRGILWQPPHVTVKMGANSFRYISPLHNNQFLILDSNIKSLWFDTDMNQGIVDRISIKFYK